MRRAGACERVCDSDAQSRPILEQYIDKTVGVPRRVKHQVTTAPVRGKTDACDSDVQEEDPWSSHRSSTLKGAMMSDL